MPYRYTTEKQLENGAWVSVFIMGGEEMDRGRFRSDWYTASCDARDLADDNGCEWLENINR